MITDSEVCLSVMALHAKHVWRTYLSNKRVLYSWTFAVMSGIKRMQA